MPVGAVYEKNINFSNPGYERRPKNLYITTASMYNSLSFNSTVRFLEDNFVERKNTDKEIWLLGSDIEVETDPSSIIFGETDPESRFFQHEIYQFLIIDHKFKSQYSGDLFRLAYPFRGVDLDMDDEMYIYQMDTAGKRGLYQLYEVYKIYDEGPPQLNKVGEWTVDTEVLDFTTVDKNIRRRDLKVKIKMCVLFSDKHKGLFQGLNFRVTTKDALPYVGLVMDENGNLLESEDKQVYLKDGMFVEAFMEMSKILNFTYTCREPPDNQYGVILTDGTWNGMVGQLATDNADIGKHVRIKTTYQLPALILFR